MWSWRDERNVKNNSNMKCSKEISNRLKIARQRAGFRSARAFAMAHKIPYVTYSQHEAGSRRLNPDTLLKYATLLHVSPAWILSGENVGHLFVSEGNDGAAYGTNSQRKSEIDWDLFFILFDEIHAFIEENKVDVTSKDEVKLCVDFYNVLEGNAGTHDEKRTMVKNLLRSISVFDQRIDQYKRT